MLQYCTPLTIDAPLSSAIPRHNVPSDQVLLELVSNGPEWVPLDVMSQNETSASVLASSIVIEVIQRGMRTTHIVIWAGQQARRQAT